MRPVPNRTLPAMNDRTGPSTGRSEALIDGFRLRGIHLFPTVRWPYSRSDARRAKLHHMTVARERPHAHRLAQGNRRRRAWGRSRATVIDRKSTRLNSSHLVISYAVFCLKKKKKNDTTS